MADYRITVTTPDGVIRYNTFRNSADKAASIVLSELNLDPEPGTTIAVEVRA